MVYGCMNNFEINVGVWWCFVCGLCARGCVFVVNWRCVCGVFVD